MAATFGPRLSCWRRSQEARLESYFRRDREGPRLSHQGWQSSIQCFRSSEAGGLMRCRCFLEHQICGLRVGHISLHRRDIGIGGRLDGSGRCNDLIVATSERLNKRCPDPLRCSRYDRHLLCCAHDFTDLLTSYTERLGGRPASDHTCDASSRTAREQGLVVRSLQHGMKLTPSDANIATVEDRKRERVLQKTSERGFMVIAVDADDAHQIGDHTNRRLRAIDLGLYRKLVGGVRLRVDSMACAPG